MDSQINKVHSPTIFCVVLSDLMGFWDASISPLDLTRYHMHDNFIAQLVEHCTDLA